MIPLHFNTFMSPSLFSPLQENRLARETEGVEDEEGWVTVTRKTTKKQRPVARTETMQKRVQSQEKEKREKKELVNFYSFQMRETKRERK